MVQHSIGELGLELILVLGSQPACDLVTHKLIDRLLLLVVTCVLSWHVLSEGQLHYQRGHTSLQCVECREC